MKPFAESRFAETIERLRKDRGLGAPADGVPRLLRDLGRRPDRLLVPEGRRIVPVAVSAIGWIQAKGDYARIYAGNFRLRVRRPGRHRTPGRSTRLLARLIACAVTREEGPC